MIEVEYENGSVHTYDTTEEAEEAIEQAHADGLGVYMITDGKDDNNQYSCLWKVTLQKEF